MPTALSVGHRQDITRIKEHFKIVFVFKELSYFLLLHIFSGASPGPTLLLASEYKSHRVEQDL